MRLIALGLLFGMGTVGWGQLPPMPMPEETVASSDKPTVYDVVSIKVNKTGDGRMSWRTTADGMQMLGVPVMNLLVTAYGLYGSPEKEITGLPKWAETTRFDVEAKVSAEDAARYKKITAKEYQAMLQALLVERFALVAKPVTNDRPVYALVIAKGGPKLTASTIRMGEDGKPVRGDSTRTGSGRVEATEGTTAALADMLTDDVGRTVVDKTGLKGKYDYALRWTPDEVADAGTDNGKAPAPPLFTAIQEQLGLRLDPDHGPVKGLVVERLEMPSAN